MKNDYPVSIEQFTAEELETLTRLVRNGITVHFAPIEIEDHSQFETLHITQDQCRTWHIGSEKVLVHLTPTTEETYRFLLNELRSKHRKGYRSVRCMIPGRQKPLIRCPDTNKCSDCPYGRKPEDRDPNESSWYEFTENGMEPQQADNSCDRAFTHLVYAELLEWMEREDPAIAEVFHLKEHDGLPVADIAEQLGVTPRRVYYLLRKAEAIRAKYNND